MSTQTPQVVLQDQVNELTHRRATYDRTRQVAFYVFGFAQILGTILVIILILQFRDEANRRNDDAAGRAQRTQDLITAIGRQDQQSLNTQTIALEKFILEALSGKTPPPRPIAVFPQTFSTPSAGSGRPPPVTTPSPRPTTAPPPSAAPRPSPTPSPTRDTTCGRLGIPSVPVLC